MNSEKIKIISQEHKYSSDEKLKHLGYGEWIEEPDEVIFEYKGYNCIIFRIFVLQPYTKEVCFFGGHLCAYVDLPSNNKFFNKNYKDIEIVCHGGLTYSQEIHGKWRIGFDCGHSYDYIPSIENFKKSNDEMKKFKEKFPIYRNIEFCINECCIIVDQLEDLK